MTPGLAPCANSLSHQYAEDMFLHLFVRIQSASVCEDFKGQVMVAGQVSIQEQGGGYHFRVY